MRLADIAAIAQIARRAKRHADRRQHVRVAVFPAPARAGGGHRLPLDHEVPERPQRHDRRLRGRARRRARRAAAVHPQRGRRGRRPVRRLAGAPRDEDAASPHATARRERPRDREVAGGAGWPGERSVHRPADAPATRARAATDERLRRNDQRRARNEGARRARARPRPRVRARRVARRRGIVDQPAGRHDARVCPTGSPGGHGPE